jgi:hypothetical protein
MVMPECETLIEAFLFEPRITKMPLIAGLALAKEVRECGAEVHDGLSARALGHLVGPWKFGLAVRIPAPLDPVCRRLFASLAQAFPVGQAPITGIALRATGAAKMRRMLCGSSAWPSIIEYPDNACARPPDRG